MESLQGIVKAICISEARGTQKHPVTEARLLQDYGIAGDAHAGHWHRQVSLLSYDKVKEFNEKGAHVGHGAFGENLVVEGLDFANLPVGTTLTVGTATLRTTQIGKECHSHCAIYQKMGECIMPTQGTFAEVLSSGTVHTGDVMEATLPALDAPFRAAVITLSDQGFQGLRKDESGPAAVQMLEEQGYQVVETLLLPDEPKRLEQQLIRLADGRQVDLILTSGGTGFSLRDWTPEATLAVADRNAPGIAEYMRLKSMEITPRGMLSRSVSVIRKKTLIVNLPGSPKAVRENLGFILPALDHGLGILRGSAKECAATGDFVHVRGGTVNSNAAEAKKEG